MPSAQITKLFSEAIKAAIPDGALNVATWAPKYRVLSPERTNAERAGRWTNAPVPHLVAPMEWFTEPECEEIVICASSQIAKTEYVNNCIGFAIHIAPGPMAYLGEEEGKAKAWKKECFDLMVRDTPALRELVSDGRGRKSENTQTGATFPGGRLNVLWATSPATVSSRPVQYLFIDERDAMGPTKEGDAPAIARARNKTFKGSRKIVTISSPRNRLENPPDAAPDTPRRSPIEHEYHNTDRNKVWVPCPHCGEFQILAWYDDRCCCPPRDEPCNLKHGSVQWEKDDPTTAFYVCVNGCEISEDERLEMLDRAEMRPEAPYRGKHGLWINELYSKFSSLADMATAYIDAKRDPSGEKLKAFENTALAIGYQEREGEIETEDLVELQESYDHTQIPEEVLIVVGAVDVQKNRLELELKGYGLAAEGQDRFAYPQSWGLEYIALEGDPERPEVWAELEAKRETIYTTPSGRQIRISSIAIDTGYLPARVYKFIGKNRGRGYFAVRGANTPGRPLISKPTKVGDPPVRLWTVGTETAKDSIANRLELKDKTAPGFCHFGKHYPEHYFRQLRAEMPDVRYIRGRAFRVWRKIKDWYRNEALDLFVYCEAVLAIALRILKTNFARLERQAAEERARIEQQKRGDQPEKPRGGPAESEPEDDEDRFELSPRRPFLPERRRNFVTD
jgi:phage terminase large subunit GpA-like protein